MTGSPAPEPAEAPSWRRSARWFAVYLLLALATHAHVLLHAMPCDDSLYIRYARDWSAGARLYHDRYEQKSPVVFWLFRAIDGRDPRASLYVAGALLAAVASSALRPGLAGAG